MRNLCLRAMLMLVVMSALARGQSTASVATTVPSQTTQPTTTRSDFGPKVVVLKQLENLYTPVPFEHARHAEMAEMWDRCVMCHHREPEPATQPVTLSTTRPATQADSGTTPACKSCHPVDADQADLRRPSLKGAYHRQCLNCHREWTGENACVVCHTAKDSAAASAPVVTSDDIIGRMHPPIKAKDVFNYSVRFEPVAGPKVLFRHAEHIDRFGLKCVECHRRDNCSDCHKGEETPESARPHPIKTSRTWRDTHGPCVDCHLKDDCTHCHYQPNQPAPAAFDHAKSGQSLNKDHDTLKCSSCHANPRQREQIACGDASCHPKSSVTFPAQRPGQWVKPAAVTTAPSTTAPTDQPVTRPVIIRIRRGGR